MKNIDKTVLSKTEPRNQNVMWIQPTEQGAQIKAVVNGKWELIGKDEDAYRKPASGIPESDLEKSVRNAIDNAVSIEQLENGEIVPALAGTLESWNNRNALNVQDTFTEQVRTTAGDVSIDSSKGGVLISIVAGSDFKADAFVTSGFNRLHNARTVGNSMWFVVPALEFGSFGTASKPNGILFTNANGENLIPIVRFKKLSQGEPVSASDGVVCTYTDSNGYRFYTCDEVGFMIVSAIDFANTCAHIAWSRRYDDYVTPDDPNDAGSSISLTSILNVVHSDVKKLLVTGGVSDRIDFNGTQAIWTRKVGHVIPTWTTAANEVSEGQTQTYTHTATITGMKPGGAAEVENSSITLGVDGTVVSYVDENSSATTSAVKYELATVVTGSVSVSNALTVEDWGLEYFTNQSGEAFATTQYAQGYPDAVAALISNMDQSTVPVISAAFAQIDAEINGIKEALKGYSINIQVNTVDSLEYKTYGKPMYLTCSTAGAPAAARIPNEWDVNKHGYWTGVPYAPNMFYTDTAEKHVYYAPVCTNSTADWIQLC